MKHQLLIAAILLTGASALQSAGKQTAQQLAWLGGCWSSKDAEAGSGEQWTPLAGGSMLGVSRTVQQGKTVAFEFMRIAADDDGALAFYAQPSGRPATKFSMLSLSETQVIFENLDHDFPQRVIYEFHPPSSLHASIEGMRKGELKRVEFPMVRISCDAKLAQASRK
jgi:Domain of unknown function (DUF6265)